MTDYRYIGVGGLKSPQYLEFIAKICHEANRSYCQSLGDNSQVEWSEAPEWQKESAISGVKFIFSHPDAKPSASHDNWLMDKAAAGWKYGPVKNEKTKEHPCFVPYHKLPPEQQAKDHIFRGIVLAFIASTEVLC